MTTVIKVEDISKSYVLNHQKKAESYITLRDEVTNSVKNIFRKEKNISSHQEEFWALQDLNFEIKQGERVGIIGRNGAGKSTLLKILSRIVAPTHGQVKIKGRVASLLEVGTGFHPELTGRENIYLNGAILGMKKYEIKRKFDEIVSFAEVEKFLDTPVKRYSSGMYVRLAFSVAAHLEPEVLIVDEVLAVGDAEFQKKCLGRMKEIGNEGRTVIFVSHNLEAVQRLCNRGIILERGSISFESNIISESITKYVKGTNLQGELVWKNEGERFKNDYFTIESVSILDNLGGMPIGGVLNKSESYNVVISGFVGKEDRELTLGYQLLDEKNNVIFWSYFTDHVDEKSERLRLLKSGKVSLTCKIPIEILNTGIHTLEVIGGLHFREWLFEPGNTISLNFNIVGNLSKSPYWVIRRPGAIAPVYKWEIR